MHTTALHVSQTHLPSFLDAYGLLLLILVVSGDHKAHLITDTEGGTFPASLSVALVEEDAGPFPINIVGDEAILHYRKRGGREREEGREGRRKRKEEGERREKNI